MNSTAIPVAPSNASIARLQPTSSDVLSTGVSGTLTSVVSQITTVITDTLGNDSLNLNSSYSPDKHGNWSSSVNATQIPSEDDDKAIKRLVVILTNIFVVFAIIVTCVLAFRHRKWENMMRSEQQKEPICKYDTVKIDDGEEEEIEEDEEIFEK